jgi:hypothetical protein
VTLDIKKHETPKPEITLIHTSSGIREGTLFVYFKQRREGEEDRVVEDSVRIVCR